MTEPHINQDDRERAEETLNNYQEDPSDFEDVSDEFLPPDVQSLFADWLRDECSRDELMDRLEELSSEETGMLFVALRNHYERKLDFIRDAAQSEISA